MLYQPVPIDSSELIDNPVTVLSIKSATYTKWIGMRACC